MQDEFGTNLLYPHLIGFASLPPSGCHSVRQPLFLIFANFSALCESQSASQSPSSPSPSSPLWFATSNAQTATIALPPPSICFLGPVLFIDFVSFIIMVSFCIFQHKMSIVSIKSLWNVDISLRFEPLLLASPWPSIMVRLERRGNFASRSPRPTRPAANDNLQPRSHPLPLSPFPTTNFVPYAFHVNERRRVCPSACIPLRQLGLCWPQLWKWLKLQIVAAKFSGRRNLNGGKPPRSRSSSPSHLNCTHISSNAPNFKS